MRRATSRRQQGLRGILRDAGEFLVKSPATPTLIRFASESDRDRYHARILQRLGKSVDQYGVLNIHRIGIDAPALLVWAEALRWGPESTYWPAIMTPMERTTGSGGPFELFLFGWRRPIPGLRHGLFGFEFVPLLRMDFEKRQDTPGNLDPDNARFLLYRGVAGYPIGLFSLYVRSAIAAEGEREATQVFFVVAFDFYGRPDWSRRGPIRWIWERIHNRVTANVLNRFKEECERTFASIQAGTPGATSRVEQS